MSFPPRRQTALVVVDMQCAFLDPTSTMAAAGFDVTPLKAALPGVLRLIALARAAQVPVIYTRFVYHRGLADFNLRQGQNAQTKALRLPIQYLEEGSAGVELTPELSPAAGEFVIDKARASAFYGTRLEPLLGGLGTRNLVICGVTTNICVETTARDAGQRDYGTWVVRDAVAEFTPERNEHALNSIGWSFGDVISIEDVARAWAPMPEDAA
ncbi:MAG: isochorismatase family cysteine hydrolase [Gemmobacter sp.]|nr:isochorismatase family cysteine hydrolase [Gemmobacter sp.]